VLDLIARRLAGDRSAQAGVDEMRRRYPKGFVAHLQGNVLPRMRKLTRYLVKSAVSPPLALSPIVAYDRECGTVTVLVSRSSAAGQEDGRDREPGDLYWAHGAAHFAEGVSAHPLVWLAVDLHPEKGACAAAAASRSGRAAGVAALRWGVGQSARVPGAHARGVWVRSASLSALWW